MLSELLDSSSSDAKSFDEEDMYGSNSDIEIISLLRGSNQAIESQDHPVCTYNVTYLSYLTALSAPV